MRNRSSCASGSGKVPSYSMGFWVAMTMKGAGSGRVTPSTVTWRSSMASRSADWVFGVARLISSVSTICAMTGPGRNSNSWVAWLKIETPVTSEGSRSGVNWMRWKVQAVERASARASMVLPTPGTSSSSRWPRQSRVTSASRASWDLPMMTRSTLSSRRSETMRGSSTRAPACSAVGWARAGPQYSNTTHARCHTGGTGRRPAERVGSAELPARTPSKADLRRRMKPMKRR